MHSLQCRRILGGRKLVNRIATMKPPSLILWQRKIGESRNNNPYGRSPPPFPWLAPFPPLFGSFNMALSRLKPFARARWKRLHCRLYYALGNSSCAQPHPQPSLPGWPPPPPLPFSLPWMANSWVWGLLSCQIPRGGDKKRGQMPRHSSTLQHFSLITQSNSANLSILINLRSGSIFVSQWGSR